MDRKGFWFRGSSGNRKSILLFAYKLKGQQFHGTTIMERKMGEISKRMKNKVSWSAKGAENLAGLLMKSMRGSSTRCFWLKS